MDIDKLRTPKVHLINQDIMVQHKIFSEPNKCDLIEEKDTLSMRILLPKTFTNMRLTILNHNLKLISRY